MVLRGWITTHCMSYMLPETAWNPLPLLPTDTYLTHTAATKRAAAEGIFPPRSHHMMRSWPLFTGREGLMKQNEGWRVKSKKIHTVPKSEDAKHSLTEQEAKARQQSHARKTTFMRSASGLSCSKNKPSTVAEDHLNHTCLPGHKWVNQKKEKNYFLL